MNRTEKPVTLADLSTLRGQNDSPSSHSDGLVPALTIVSHPRAERIGDQLRLDRLFSGRPVELSRVAPDFLAPGRSLGSPLADLFVSRKPLVFTANGAQDITITVPPRGMQVVIDTPVKGQRILTIAEVQRGVPIELAERIVVLLHLAPAYRAQTTDELGMVGISSSIVRVRQEIEQVADLPVSVLIRGETGTGKELVARAIHDQSPRGAQPFIGVNMAALPRELATTELFGAHKGAYTGAVQEREGLFRAADEGTLFLDEIGEASPEIHALLLRALETGEILPIGADAPIRLNVRLLAATDAPLEEAIESGQFKAPLLHRLAGYEIWVPTLRTRREDIGLLFARFVAEELEDLNETHILAPSDPRAEPWLPPSLATRLLLYEWPGNVRELRNIARQLVIRNRGKPALNADPRLWARLSGSEASEISSPEIFTPPAPLSRQDSGRRRPADVCEEELLAALRKHAWDLQAAANELGIPRSSMYHVIDRHPQIRTAGELSPDEIRTCFRECDGDLDEMVMRLEVSRHALKRRIRELGLVRSNS